MRRAKPDPALAATIRRLREDRGITLETLAYEAGITTGSLDRIELAQSAPYWGTVKCVAAALGLSIAELAKRSEAS